VALGLRVRLGVGVQRMAMRPVSTADILHGHVDLDLECLDRIYLNGYVPNLQLGGQVVSFLGLRGFPIPSPAVINRIGDGFRRSVRSFAEANQIPIIKFGKGIRKIDAMHRYLRRQEASGQPGVAAIGWAQEFQRVATCTITEARNGGAPHFGWDRAERRVTCYYFYVWDDQFGPGMGRRYSSGVQQRRRLQVTVRCSIVLCALSDDTYVGSIVRLGMCSPFMQTSSTCSRTSEGMSSPSYCRTSSAETSLQCDSSRTSTTSR
jgi:hypothetical protein